MLQQCQRKMYRVVSDVVQGTGWSGGAATFVFGHNRQARHYIIRETSTPLRILIPQQHNPSSLDCAHV